MVLDIPGTGDVWIVFADTGPGIIVRGYSEHDVCVRLRRNRQFTHAAMGALPWELAGDIDKAGAVARGLDYELAKRIATRLEAKTLHPSSAAIQVVARTVRVSAAIAHAVPNVEFRLIRSAARTPSSWLAHDRHPPLHPPAAARRGRPI